MKAKAPSPRNLQLAAVLLCLTGGLSAAPKPQEATPSVRFEVVSVKPGKPECATVMIGPSPDGFHLHCLSLLQLVRYAYGLSLFEESNVLNLPAWANTERFDVDTPVQESDRERFGALSAPEKAQLLRAVLAERFALRTHEEQREMPIYALVQSKPPLKLKAAAPAAPGSAEKPTLRRVRRNRIEAYGCSMEQFVSFITPLRGRPVLDRTGLSGLYDFALDFTPETGDNPTPESDAAPSIFTAVQEQLGLRLVPDKAAQRIVVVDAVAQPTEN